MSTATAMTVEEFAQLATAETEDYELVEGELVPLPSATPVHAAVRGDIEFDARLYFRSNPIGAVYSEVDCRVGPETVRRPDLSLFLWDRLKDVDEEKVPFPFAPDIAVEVLSPSESAIEITRKTKEYLAAGSKEVWVVDHPNATMFVHTPAGIRVLEAEDELTTPLLPGFSISLAKLLKARELRRK